MASELYVETLKGLTSGANANKVIIPSGQTLEVADGLRSADMPTGSVLQVVSTTSGTEQSTGSTSFVATNLSASITPSSTSSKILISYTTSIGSNTNGFTATTIYKGSTNLGQGSVGFAWGKDYDNRWAGPASGIYLDSPSTTSSVTYTVYFRTQESGHTSYVQFSHARGAIVIMEIAG